MAGLALLLPTATAAPADPLPSWAATPSEAAILDFVARVTDPASDDFVPEARRIAVFDNDGTLWSERPIYFQALYALDRLREKAAADPSVLTSDLLRAAARGDMASVTAAGAEGLIEIADPSHSGVTVEAFQADARDWLTTATHPETGLAYAAMTYQPMTELLRYLRDEGFTTWIVSGGGVDFIRAISEDAYGIPPEQVVGSEGVTAYEVADGAPRLVKRGGISFIDDGPGKPVGIARRLGRRPILAVGNSDGDFEMLDWVTAGDGPRLGVLIRHTDADREFAYDREARIGRLDRALDAAGSRGWVVVDMARDWTRIWTGGDP